MTYTIFRALLVVFIISSGFRASASDAGVEAEGWERLPDGRVVIEIYGQRLAFPTDEETLDRISFSLDAAEYGDYPRVSPRLREIVAQPETTRRLISELETEGKAELIITDFLHLPISGSGNPLVAERPIWARAYIYIRPAPVKPRPIGSSTGCNSVESDSPIPDGFTIHSVRTTSHRKYPITTIEYCLPAAKRKFKAVGKQVFEPRNATQISFGSSDGSIGAVVSFSSTRPSDSKPPYSKQTTPSQWAEVDRQLHEYFSNMFIDLPEGALQ